MKEVKTNLPKKGAGRRLAARLKELGDQQPSKTLVRKINNTQEEPGKKSGTL